MPSIPANILDIIAKLETPEKCETVEKNAIREGRSDFAVAARKRALELRARAYNGSNEVERKCLEAIYAYEQVLSAKNGKKTYASRTWPMVKRYRIIGAVERAVNRPTETAGYTALTDMGLEDYAFEAVILEHPNYFSEESVKRSRERVSERASNKAKV